jgi:Sulfotransferase family
LSGQRAQEHPRATRDALAGEVHHTESGPLGRVPEFFIVGHAKSGTTALYEMLRRHPQIFMPDFKEPWFFSTDMRPRFQPPRAGRLPQTLEEYMLLFADAREDQLAGEASASYLWSKTAAQAIAEVRPDARIIAILREPASFLRSLHMQFLESHVEAKQDLRTALALEERRREGKQIPRGSHRPQLLMYSDHVRYVEQLSRYRERFGSEQMLILIYDDFRADNEAVVRSVLRHLGVDETIPVDVMEVNSTNRSMRSQALDDLVHAVSVGRGPASRAAKSAIKMLTPRRLRRDALGVAQRRIVHGATRPPDESLMLELRRRYRDEVLALSDYLGRDLVKLWGYDDLG